MRLSRWWRCSLAALAGRDAFESLVVRADVLSVALAGREVFESLVVGVVLRRIGRTKGACWVRKVYLFFCWWRYPLNSVFI